MMCSLSFWRRSGSMLMAAALCLLVVSGTGARQTFQSKDNNLGFDPPKRWQVEESNDRVQLTAPDGSHYTLLRDTLSPAPSGSPATDPAMKAAAVKLVAPLLKNAEFVSVQSLTMDHGAGAVFRFKGKTEDGPNPPVYIAVVGKHSVVVLPEKAGQPGQSIGLATIFQTLAFEDSLPKQPVPPRQRPDMPASPGKTGSFGVSTVSFQKQIAPILKEKCEVCHRTRSPLGGLSVSTYAEFFKGGRGGGILQPGKPESSTLLAYLTGRRTLMPKGGPPLPDSDIALFRTWITEGARDDSPGAPSPPASNPASDPAMSEMKTEMKKSNEPLPGGRPFQQGRMNRPGAGGRGMPANGTGSDAVGPTLMEAYSGHLTPVDLSFEVRLRRDGTATATWMMAPGRGARYGGTYVGEEGNYVVTLTQVGTGDPSLSKTLTLDLRARGSQEVGRYGLDGMPARRDITNLQLTELGVKTNSGGGGRAGANKNRTRRPGK
jgi:hypothetical protein